MNAALEKGPFYHGTEADLKPGDLLTAGFPSNYRPEILMNHIYFTALRDGAGLAAELAAVMQNIHGMTWRVHIQHSDAAAFAVVAPAVESRRASA